MCGIAGIVRTDRSISPRDCEGVAAMVRRLAHRGPDGSGLWNDSCVAFGHRRLSIIDLSPAGNQPLGNEDGSVLVTFNGEIYNYRELCRELKSAGHCFRSASDTEAIVHGYEQWGIEGLLQRLRGMFAFALYDGKRSVVFAARDRMGIKPFYYATDAAGGFAFASELRALIRGGFLDRSLSEAGLTGFLLYGSLPHPLTIYRDALCLEPAHYMVISQGGATTHRYWAAGLTQSAAGVGDILGDTVQRHLISDAPLGIFLSAGVDSTALAVLAARSGQQMRTLTVTFDERGHDESTGDASAWHGGTHHEARVTYEDFLDTVPRFLESIDQPSNDGLNTFFVSRAAQALGLRAVLSGAGADEIFWGYRHHHLLSRLGPALQAWRSLWRPFRTACASLAAVPASLGGRESYSRLAHLALETPVQLYLALRGFFSGSTIQRLLGVGPQAVSDVIAATGGEMGHTGAAGFQRMELNRYLHDQLLRDADVFGMACSVEIRVPFVDPELVQTVISRPESRVLRKGVNKPLLVDAVRDHRVDAAARRPKTGFTLPLREWMLRDSGSFLERALRAEFLDRREVKRLWRDFEAGRINASRAWSLVVLGALHDAR